MKKTFLSLMLISAVIVSFVGYPTDQESANPDVPTPQQKSAPLTQTQPEIISPPESYSPPSKPDPVSQTPIQPTPYEERVVGDTIVTETGESYPQIRYSVLAMPNDPNANQWWVTNTNLLPAWEAGPASDETILAIIDTGFALNHDEFQDRWYSNSGEVGTAAAESASVLNCTGRGLALSATCNLVDDDYDGVLDNETDDWFASYENPSLLNCTARALPLNKSCNLIDDDANGYIDDVTGWDFTAHYPSVLPGRVNTNGYGVDHGTIVAGISGATGNNAKGIAGVDWYTKILPLQALDDNGSGTTLSVARAVRYAADRGADVINMSLGSDYNDSYLRSSIQYAIARGSIVVAASGNDGCNCMSYPARYDEVLAVGASDQANNRVSFSSYGSALDVLAPGIDMRGPTWTAANQTSAYVSGVAGTSFASPYVAGMLTRLKGLTPTAHNYQLIAAVTEGVERLTLPSTTARSDLLGYGRVNVGASVARLTTASTPQLLSQLAPVSSGRTLGTYEPSVAPRFSLCPDERIGSTPIYRLKSSSRTLYTASQVERHQASISGYAVTLVGYSCVSMPFESPVTSRQISLYAEIDNLNPAKQ